MNKLYGWIRETPDAGTMKPGDRYATRALTARLDLDSFALDVDFLRVFVLPVVLISVAYVLGAGRRIQKDTEGLV